MTSPGGQVSDSGPAANDHAVLKSYVGFITTQKFTFYQLHEHMWILFICCMAKTTEAVLKLSMA